MCLPGLLRLITYVSHPRMMIVCCCACPTIRLGGSDNTQFIIGRSGNIVHLWPMIKHIVSTKAKKQVKSCFSKGEGLSTEDGRALLKNSKGFWWLCSWWDPGQPKTDGSPCNPVLWPSLRRLSIKQFDKKKKNSKGCTAIHPQGLPKAPNCTPICHWHFKHHWIGWLIWPKWQSSLYSSWACSRAFFCFGMLSVLALVLDFQPPEMRKWISFV